jgi:hypothetical protein
MHLVFMNSLERRTEENRVVTAQVSILEQDGVWSVYWSEPMTSGELVQTKWFEGNSWDAMLKTFRSELLRVMAQGYAPLFDNVTTDMQSHNGRTEWVQKLYYYSDVHKHVSMYDELREWRRQQAGKEKKAPYMVATNRLLSLISTFLPHSDDELLQLPGFGPFKLKLYGKAILSITTRVARETIFPLDWVMDHIDYAQYKLWLHNQQLSFEERDRVRKEQRGVVLEAAQAGATLKSLEDAKIDRRTAMVLIEELEQAGVDMEPIIAAELQDIPISEQQRVRTMFASAGDRYLKPIYQKLIGDQPWKEMTAEAAYEKLRLFRMQHRRTKQHQMENATKAS